MQTESPRREPHSSIYAHLPKAASNAEDVPMYQHDQVMIIRRHPHTGKRFQINNINLFHYPGHLCDLTPLWSCLCGLLPPPKTANEKKGGTYGLYRQDSSTFQQPKTWYPH